MAEFPDQAVGRGLVAKADVLVLDDLVDPDQVGQDIGELLVLVGLVGEGVRPGEGRLDVLVPVGPEQLLEGGRAAGDALLGLPDEVAQEPGDVDGIRALYR